MKPLARPVHPPLPPHLRAHVFKHFLPREDSDWPHRPCAPPTSILRGLPHQHGRAEFSSIRPDRWKTSKLPMRVSGGCGLVEWCVPENLLPAREILAHRKSAKAVLPILAIVYQATTHSPQNTGNRKPHNLRTILAVGRSPTKGFLRMNLVKDHQTRTTIA